MDTTQTERTCPNCLKGFKASYGSRIRFCCRDCRFDYYRSHPKQKRKDTNVRKAKYVTLTCDFCSQEFDRLESDAKRTKMKFCSRDCYAKGGASKAAMGNGRPRTRPGGDGLPPNAQPETIEASKKWPVLSWFDDNGYILLYMPSCPYVPKSTGRIFEHRLVMAMHEGRKLYRNEHVDHINQIRNDNRFENLQILSPSDHSKKTNKENHQEWKKKAQLWDSLPDEIKAQYLT